MQRTVPRPASREESRTHQNNPKTDTYTSGLAFRVTAVVVFHWNQFGVVTATPAGTEQNTHPVLNSAWIRSRTVLRTLSITDLTHFRSCITPEMSRRDPTYMQ